MHILYNNMIIIKNKIKITALIMKMVVRLSFIIRDLVTLIALHQHYYVRNYTHKIMLNYLNTR